MLTVLKADSDMPLEMAAILFLVNLDLKQGISPEYVTVDFIAQRLTSSLRKRKVPGSNQTVGKNFYAPPPPLKKEGHIALHMSVRRSVCPSVRLSVGMSVSLNLVQLITQEGFAPEASNLVGR